MQSVSRSGTQSWPLPCEAFWAPRWGLPGDPGGVGPFLWAASAAPCQCPLGLQGSQKVPVWVTSQQPRAPSASSSGPRGRAGGAASLPGAELISRPQGSIVSQLVTTAEESFRPVHILRDCRACGQAARSLLSLGPRARQEVCACNTRVLAWRARHRGGTMHRSMPARPSRSLLSWHFWTTLNIILQFHKKKFQPKKSHSVTDH